MTKPSTPEEWQRHAEALDAALAVHRQHIAAARRAVAENDDGRLREVLTEVLTSLPSTGPRRDEGDGGVSETSGVSEKPFSLTEGDDAPGRSPA